MSIFIWWKNLRKLPQMERDANDEARHAHRRLVENFTMIVERFRP